MYGFSIMFSLVRLFILVVIIFIVVKIISGNSSRAPRLTVEAVLVNKRISDDTMMVDNGMGGMNTTTSTSYYLTFQVESGDRMKFRVNRTEYDLLLEGDYGYLKFQGKRFIAFERRQYLN